MQPTRNTVQRGLVLQAVQSLRNHPTAEEIYSSITQTHPSISRGTVYRNLNLLVQQGAVRRVSHLQNAADRFDFELTPHYHFHCTGCNGVFDVEMPYQQNLLKKVQNPQGFQFESYEITFTGLCNHCKAN
ncbi:transcriptional repressor [Ruminococcaceae bacterium OttesenSCG-928-A16]|nr:transcriptional repressor [Ruminococcaceae bacterium OttesenSCG-928-A16]